MILRAAASIVMLVVVTAGSAASVNSETLAALVNAAVEDVKSREVKGSRWGFTVKAQVGNNIIVAGFDPRASKGKRWKLVSPELSGISDDEFSLFEEISHSDNADLDILLDRPFDLVGENPMLVENHEAELTVHAPVAPEMMGEKGYEQKLLGATRIGKAPARFLSYRLFAPQPFNVNPLVSFSYFEIVMEIGAVIPGGPMAMLSSEEKVAGRAFFSDYHQVKTKAYSGFFKVVPPGGL